MSNRGREKTKKPKASLKRHEGSDDPGLRPPKKTWRLLANAQAELLDLPDKALGGLTDRMERHALGETRTGTHFKHIGDGLYELRYEHMNNHYRLIFMQRGDVYVGLTAFGKNQEKLPAKDLNRAKQREKSWDESVKSQGTTAVDRTKNPSR